MFYCCNKTEDDFFVCVYNCLYTIVIFWNYDEQSSRSKAEAKTLE